MESFKAQLQAFYEYYGHTYVSPKDNKPLYLWIHHLRVTRHKLDFSMTNFLNSFNLDWMPYNKYDQHWLFMYNEIIVYKKSFGDTRVSINYKEDKRLGVWVSEQRKGKQNLLPWKIKLLDDIGFVWKIDVEGEREQLWNQMYERLLAFKAKFGHTHVLPTFSEDSQLANWVRKQREYKDNIPQARREKLVAIGFNLGDFDEQSWEKKYQELKEFKSVHNHLRVSSVDPKYYQLHLWVIRQRKDEKGMPAHRKEKLDALGFRWKRKLKIEQSNNWNQRYQELVDFYKINGHCRVSRHSQTSPQLSIWVSRHRLNWDKLSEKQQKKLEELEFTLPEDIEKERRQKWLMMLQKLRKFKKEFGNCRVPSIYKADPALGRWVDTQRRNENKMPDWKKIKLDEIGFDWSSDIKTQNIKRWYEMYERLVNFYTKYGHSKVPEYFKDDPKLSIWVMAQRRPKKPLSQDRINLLKEVNFVFKPSEHSRNRDAAGRYMKETPTQ